MNYKDELMKIYDECIAETFGNEELDENDKLGLDLLREAVILQIASEAITEKDQKFVMDHLDLYKNMIRALFVQDETEIMKATLELLKAKNREES